mgnify:CR=1 FL=1
MASDTIYNHQELANYKFIFACYSNKDKVWYVQQRKFILTSQENRNILLGEFMQSLWFQVKYTKNSHGVFVVLKVNKNTSTKTIEKDMNSLKNPFPSLYDIPPYVKRGSYFNMPLEIINNCIEISKSHEIKFTLRAYNCPWDKLTFSIYNNPTNQDEILLSLPSFELPLHH